MNFIQPSIDPVIFSLGILDIRWYSLSYIIGLLAGLLVIKKLNRKGNIIINLDKCLKGIRYEKV